MNHFTRAAKVFSLFAAVCLTCLFLQKYCFVDLKHDADSIRAFYQEEPNSLDLVLIGASEISRDFAPVQAYQEQGFTSYVYYVDGNCATMLKMQVQEVLAHQDPQWIVIEVNSFSYNNEKSINSLSAERRYLDNVPLSKNKAAAIQQYISPSDWPHFFFPLIKYHDNWKYAPDYSKIIRTVAALDHKNCSRLKGISTSTVIDQKEMLTDLSFLDETQPLIELSEQRLRELLQFLRDNGLENVLFVRFPHKPITASFAERAPRVNRVGEIITEYGYDFWNFDREDLSQVLRYDHDFYNEEHMNVFGQKAFTTYFSQLLVEHYGLTPRPQSPELRQRWEGSAVLMDAYYADVGNMIEKQEKRFISEFPYLSNNALL